MTDEERRVSSFLTVGNRMQGPEILCNITNAKHHLELTRTQN